MSNKVKILVIDDEPQIRKLLKLTLEANDFDVSAAETGQSGIQLAASLKPELILLDLNLPDIAGLDVLKEIRQWSAAQIIVLSVRSSETDKIDLLDSGADDYVTKPFHAGELLARLRVALRHMEPPEDFPVQVIDEIEINYASRMVRKSSMPVNLTSTEYAILKLLFINKDKALTHKQILESIWGHQFSGETQYLRVFIGQIRKKIEDDAARPRHLKTIPGVGYIFVSDSA